MERNNTLRIKRNLMFFFFLCSFPASTFAQKTDTLTFHSDAFNDERNVYVQIPELAKYRSYKVKLPVIYILDGQHDWFVEPLFSTIKYLQYTHEIPNAILVIIPLKNRVRECGIRDMNDTLPLHNFITKELPHQISKYNPNGYNILIGHSFSASFALYSLLKAPEFYNAVFANSPLDQMDNILAEINKSARINKKSVFLSVGGADDSKDFYHREKYEELKRRYPGLFKEINTYEANASGHTAVPIVADPVFLSMLFINYRKRYSEIADVDDKYKLVSKPLPIKKVISQIDSASFLNGVSYSMEIPDINGIASRYLNSGYDDYGIAIYEKGITYYPNYYGFHVSIAKLYLKTDKKKAIPHLEKAIELVKNYEPNQKNKEELILSITKMM